MKLFFNAFYVLHFSSWKLHCNLVKTADYLFHLQYVCVTENCIKSIRFLVISGYAQLRTEVIYTAMMIFYYFIFFSLKRVNFRGVDDVVPLHLSQRPTDPIPNWPNIACCLLLQILLSSVINSTNVRIDRCFYCVCVCLFWFVCLWPTSIP